MMQDILLVIDMQNDFIDGALGSTAAQAIVPYVVERVKQFEGTVLFALPASRGNWRDAYRG